MSLPQRNALRHTFGESLTWNHGTRAELIDGIAYVREPPAPSRTHQEFVGEPHFQIRRAIEGRACRAYIAPIDVRLPHSAEADEQIDTVVQPDVLIVSDLTKVDERGMRGAPDWLAEILSPASARHVQIVKLPAYERAGVREAWFVHPTDRHSKRRSARRGTPRTSPGS